MSFNRPADRAHGAFDAHKEHFSAGVEKLLAAEQKAKVFGLGILPQTTPTPVRATESVKRSVTKPVEIAPTRGYEFDVALSFAGTERALAEKLATATREAGFMVFYDAFYPEQLWGKDLVEFFDHVYRKASRFCVMFISPEYKDRMWTTQERRSALARAVEEKGNEYLLPIEVERVDIDGLRPSIGHLSLGEHTIEQISEILIKKLTKTR